MAQRFELSGKVAIVTGAARGIGYATATELARRGSIVVVVDLDHDAASAAASGLPGTAIGLAADVTDRGAMQRVVAEAVERFGGVDVVVANAGAGHPGSVAEVDDAGWARTFDLNVSASMRLARAAIKEKRQNGSVMPPGLADALTREEFRDLVRFLSELGRTK